MSGIGTLLRIIWEYLREAAGENDYRRYSAGAARRGEAPLSPREFYLQQLQRTYSRVNRCC